MSCSNQTLSIQARPRGAFITATLMHAIPLSGDSTISLHQCLRVLRDRTMSLLVSFSKS